MPATWGKNTLTNQALTMMNQALGISAITFTKAVTITDDITGDSVSQLQALTSVNYKQSRTPKAIATQDNKSRLGVTIDNSDVNEDYIYYGVGIYAKQNSTNQEVLFSVIPLTAGATMIAKENNATTASIYLDLYTDIVRGTQVTIMVSNSGTLSREDVQQMISQSIGNALNYPNETASKGIDFNAILDISITRIINDTTVVNAPSGFSGTGYLTTIGSGDKTVPIMQTLDDTINNIRSTRYFNSTTNVWSEWNAYAKTVDVNEQLDKKVNVADMRKPASDVAGIEEVNTKQDKIAYTPADDSKVVHTADTSNWQKQAMFNPGSYIITSTSSAQLDFKTLLTTKFSDAGIYYIRDDYKNSVSVVDSVTICEGDSWWYAYGVTYDGNFVHRKITEDYDSGWVINADDSKVVHSTDMRKPASDVAGIEEVNVKQDKIGYTPADDSKVLHSTITPLNSTDMNTVLTAGFYQLISGTNGMPNADEWTIYQVIPLSSTNGVQVAYETNNAILGMRSWSYSGNTFTSWVQFADDSQVAHLSGANNFDTVPTVDKNPLLLANSLPSDLARTGQDTNFTGKLQKSGIDVATVNQLPVADDSGWVAFPSNSNLYLNAYYKIFNGVLYTMGTAEPKNTNGTTEKILNVQSIISYRGYNSLSNDIQYHQNYQNSNGSEYYLDFNNSYSEEITVGFGAGVDDVIGINLTIPIHEK